MSKITTQRWLMNRRDALRGIGVTMALPLLECIAPQLLAHSGFVYAPNNASGMFRDSFPSMLRP